MLEKRSFGATKTFQDCYPKSSVKFYRARKPVLRRYVIFMFSYKIAKKAFRFTKQRFLFINNRKDLVLLEENFSAGNLKDS